MLTRLLAPSPALPLVDEVASRVLSQAAAAPDPVVDVLDIPPDEPEEPTPELGEEPVIPPDVPDPEPAPPAPDSIPVEFEADDSSGEPDQNRIRLKGNARVSTPTQEIRAGEIAANTASQEIEATGDVRVTGDGKRLEGQTAKGNLGNRAITLDGDVKYTSVLQVPNERLGPRDLPLEVTSEHIEYNFEQKTGSIRRLETVIQGVRVRGDSGVLLPDQRLQIQGAEFSFCPVDDRGRYGYHLRASQVEYSPSSGGVAQRTTLYIGNRRIASVPRYSFAQAEGEEQLSIPLPTFGGSRLSGQFISFGFQPQLFGGWMADSRLELTTRVGLRGSTTIRPLESGPSPFFRLQMKEEVEGRDPKRLLIDRLPEFGFLLDGRSTSRWKRWVRGEISYGYIRQHNPNRKTGRGQLSLLAQPIPVQDLGGWMLSARPGVHFASYTSGDSYRDLYGEVSVARRWDARKNARLGLVKHFASGTTPFRFDEALIPNELFTHLRWNVGAWGLGVNTRHDLGNNSLFDAQFRVGKVVRCVEPRLVYSTRLKQVRLEINLVGLTDAEDLPPAGTLPTPSVDDPVSLDGYCEGCGGAAAVSRR